MNTTNFPMRHFLRAALLATAMAVSANGFSQATTANTQDSFSRNPTTGDWTFTLFNPDDNTQSQVWNYTPRNQIQPAVRSSIHRDSKGFEYLYRVKNERHAKQTIAFIVMRGWFQVEGNPKKRSAAELRGIPALEIMSQSDHDFDLRQKLREQAMLSPQGWDSVWDISGNEYALYSWFPAAKDDSNFGMKPGRSQGGFGIVRPELPGLTVTKMQGSVEHSQILSSSPSDGPVALAIAQLELEDTVRTHIMVPAIAVPVPWNGAELGRRMKTHIQSWADIQAITPAMLVKLNPKLDALIAAQEAKDIRATHRAAQALMEQVFLNQHRMHHGHCMEDDEGDAHWQTPIPIVRSGGFPTLFPRKGVQPEMERIAARALIFNTIYLLTRAYIGK